MKINKRTGTIWDSRVAATSYRNSRKKYLVNLAMDFYITGLEGYFSPSAYLGHSVISYHFKTTYLNLTKFSGNMALKLVNLDFEKL